MEKLLFICLLSYLIYNTKAGKGKSEESINLQLKIFREKKKNHIAVLISVACCTENDRNESL